MKPFNLEQALAGAPVIMRDGSKVGSIVSFTNEVNQEYSIVAVVQGCVGKFTKEGVAEWGTYYDLFMAPTKKEGWINIYTGNSTAHRHTVDYAVFETKDLAQQAAGNCCIATTKIEWEE